MKTIFLLTVCLGFAVTSMAQKAQKTADYSYPDYATADTAKKSFVKRWKQGMTLYNTMCSKCHNKTVEGKAVIPDFSLPQLLDYEMRIAYVAHGDQLTDRFITDEEMTRIILYLQYKKKTGVPIRQASVL
jgi:cytochrome c5